MPNQSRKKRISIGDVAKRAGVSISTVSRVVNKLPTVNKKNISKVEEAIAHLKYKPNVIAQNLARGYNNALGLAMPGYPGIFHSFYAIELIRGVGHACESLRLDLIFHITDGTNPLNTSNLQGVIFADIIENRRQVEDALEEGIPCIVVNNVVNDIDVGYIAVDNVEGGKTAGEYLINLGHKRIATVTGNLQTQAGAERLQGFQAALKKKNVDLTDDYICKGDYSRRCARIAAEQLFSLKTPPTAIFAASDDMALEIIAYALEKGMKVPEDVSIVGFDDNPAGIFGPVGLTTIKQPLFQMAEDAVKSLNAIVSGKEDCPPKSILAPELVIRESCSKLS